MKHAVLIVDDNRSIRENLARYLSGEYVTYKASNGNEAVKLLSDNSDIEMVISDLKMPDMDGLELLEKIQADYKEIVTVMVTGHSTIESAVEAMRKGAYDYLTKPLDMNKLEVTLKNALEHRKLKSENLMLKQRIREEFNTASIVGESKKVKEILDLIKRVAPTKATVLIQGDSGTGKELVANYIHENSEVADGPFIKVNCSAFAEGVLESELFGHEKGAFTGALYMKKGRFELADGGTLFIDEIGDLPQFIQVKLLRFLQESEFERVGGTKTMKVNVRIISATNKKLDDLVREGKFREDLFYRLKVFTIDVPSLKERKEDIPLLVEHHLKRFSHIHHKNIKGISTDAMKKIKSYDWPGNIRELMNCLECAIVMTLNEEIGVESIPPFVSLKPGETAAEPRTLADIEKKAVMDAMNSSGGNKTEAAKILDIGLRTLYRKLELFGIE